MMITIIKNNQLSISHRMAAQVLLVLSLFTSPLIHADQVQTDPIIKDSIIKDSMPSKLWTLPKIYGNHLSGYSIKYPKDWAVNKNHLGLLVIQGKENTPSYQSAVNIQAVNPKEYGGKFESVKEFMYSIKYQMNKRFPDSKIVGDGSVVLTQLDGNKAVGKYLIFVFSHYGILMEQWQIVVQRHDGRVFYTWAYTSPYVQYQRDLKYAEMMLDTWYIY